MIGKLLLSYIKRHTALILALLLAMGIFAAVFSLYDLPAEAVGYAAALTAAVFLVLGAIRFTAFYRRNQALLSLERRIDVELSGLPRPSSILEAEYQALLRALFESKRSLASAFAEKQAQTEEYYTLWAHQVKTPIAAMRLMLGASDHDAQFDAELFKIEQYVEMVLNYVRAQSDETDYVLRRVSLDDIVRASLRKYARAFVLSKTKLSYAQTGLVVLTDEKWIAFCLEQILSNALKYASGGEIAIYTEGETLVIADTGIGISPEDLPRVFEKGYTGYNGRMDKRATGIGLYLVKTVLDRLGHAISIESALGRGTKVRLGLSRDETAFD
ncbi:MAG TPA: sensor histidine kinase [Clostridia bacterium]|nr:sensor histidine kinase [Clostridia bacterium]